MNLRQVEVFRAVMVSGTASKAAELLRISQPAVSKSLMELERDIGFALFSRTKGRLVATAEAAMLFREVEASFSGLTQLRATAARIRDFGSGEIRIATLSALSENIVPLALRAFQKLHPSVAITYQARLSTSVKDLVASGRFDFGIAADEIDLTGVVASPFATYRAQLGVPAGHRFVGRPVVRLEEMDGEAFIALAPEDTTRREADRAFAYSGVRPRIVIETPFSTTVCAMICAGLGCGLVNPLTAERFVGHGMELVPFELPVFFRSLLLQPPGANPSRVVQDCIDTFMNWSGSY